MPAKKTTTRKAGTKAETPKKPRARKATPKAVEADRPSPALERGDLFFFYRPDVGEDTPGGLIDVRRFHLVLRPEGKEVLRLITIGRKKLPEAVDGGRSHWAFVDRVFGTPDELKEALSGASSEAEARPAGEGVYALVRRGRDTVLAYALELPEEPGEVQRAFGIGQEGRFVVSVKNPEAGSPAGAGLEGDRRAEFPDELMERFGDRRWSPADPPEFLDHEGAELVLIGGRDDGRELGVDLEPQPEDEDDAEVFRDLHLDKSDRTIRPLFEGRWE